MRRINYKLVHMIDIIDICNDISEKLYRNYATNVYSIYKSNRNNRMMYIVHNVTDEIKLETTNIYEVLSFFEYLND